MQRSILPATSTKLQQTHLLFLYEIPALQLPNKKTGRNRRSYILIIKFNSTLNEKISYKHIYHKYTGDSFSCILRQGVCIEGHSNNKYFYHYAYNSRNFHIFNCIYAEAWRENNENFPIKKTFAAESWSFRGFRAYFHKRDFDYRNAVCAAVFFPAFRDRAYYL